MTRFRPVPVLAALFVAGLAGGGAVLAQLDGADRGVAPIDSASTFEVTGIEIDVVADNADKAREAGWKQAQEKGWKALWAKTNGRPQSQAPGLPDSTLNGMVSGIVIEQEQIGPKRYIATLGVLFDRARTGELLGVSGAVRRSAPMLLLPVMVTGGTPYSYEFRNEWQKAWARFRTGSSPVDYVRPVGNGIDPVLLNVAQTRRPGRTWWRMLLDQYGAADVIVAEVQLKRSYPGGPAIGTFIARHGPDNKILDRIVLRAGNSSAIPRMMDEGVRRLDIVFANALAGGLLHPDPSLIAPEPVPDELLEETPAAAAAAAAVPAGPAGPTPPSAAVSYTLQVATPNAAAVQQAEVSVSSIRGITSALTTSLALGGNSVMRVTFVGDSAALKAALEAQGWRVEGGGSSLRISRGGGGE
ncbi:MAG: heavy-metal-associated domain-containing protein [Alphaproteobacteria bacterium]|nr:MAG: heavy-metal-associated domain-containing protein [Alphaproteobacteria bacterium]